MDGTVATLLTAGVGSIFGAGLTSLVQQRTHRLADLLAAQAEMKKIRLDNYYALLDAASDVVAFHESLSWKPEPWRTSPGEAPSADEVESNRLTARMHGAHARINLVSRDATIAAARAYIDKVIDILEQHDALPPDHPERMQRSTLRTEFIHESRKDLDISTLGYDVEKLSWLELQMMRVPKLRQRMANRALVYEEWRAELEQKYGK